LREVILMNPRFVLASAVAVAILVGSSLVLSLRSATSEASSGDEEDQYKAERGELPGKCDCGCGMAFLDCDMDCPWLDSRSSKDEDEIADDLVVERSEVPRKALPPNRLIKGARIDKVLKDTPATGGSTKPGKKGNRVVLEEGDIITHINGEPVNSVKDYHELMRGSNEKKLTVIDWRKKKAYHDYFKPRNGLIGIRFQMVRFKIKEAD
jgi:hypothetical protein